MWVFLGVVFFSFRKAVFHESKASYCGSRVGNFKKGLLRFGKCSGVALSPHRRRSGTMPALIRLGSMGTAGAAMLCWDPEMGSHSLPMLSCVGMFCLDFFFVLTLKMAILERGVLALGPWQETGLSSGKQTV